MQPNRDNNQQQGDGPKPTGYGCGCSLPGPAIILLALIVILAYILAIDDDLRTSLLWLVMVPLIGGFILLYVRVRRIRDKQ